MNVEKIENGLTHIQDDFMSEFSESLNVRKALKSSGMTKSNFNRDTGKNTKFAVEFRKASAIAEQSFEYSKLESLRVLAQIRDDCSNDPDNYPIAINAIKEISKMQENHLAATKKEEKKINVEVKAVYDFTKKPEEITEEAEYVEI